MKNLLTGLSCWLLALGVCAQTPTNTWSVLPGGTDVVISGRGRWPASATTDAQRRAYVRQWYVRYLVDAPAEQMHSAAVEARATGKVQELTYDDLYRFVGFYDDSTALNFQVRITPDATGFAYRLNEFGFQDLNGADGRIGHYSVGEALQQRRFGPSLAAYRRRLAAAAAALGQP